MIAVEFFRLVEGVGGDKCCEPVGGVETGLATTERFEPRGV